MCERKISLVLLHHVLNMSIVFWKCDVLFFSLHMASDCCPTLPDVFFFSVDPLDVDREGDVNQMSLDPCQWGRG